MGQTYTIAEISRKLQPIFDAAPVEKAILFGSYARGNPSKSSDVDIIIDGKGKIRGIDFFGVLEDVVETLNIPVGLIEASQIIDGGRVQREIAKNGVVIYEKA
jgi:predicted nucleotidyltransferase